MPGPNAARGPFPRRRPAHRREILLRVGPALLTLGVALLLLATACRTQRPYPPPGGTERGIASWYGEPFQGRQTASGEIFDTYELTAAHRTLPFQTLVEMVNLDNGRRVVVRINDRGPFVRGRIVDLSYAAARRIDMVGPGTARVELRVLGPGQPPDRRPLEPPIVTVASAPPSEPPDTVPSHRPPSPGRRTAGPPRIMQPLPVQRYTVQVGAFQDPHLAAALRDELSHRYRDVVVASDGVWHRVQVGSYARRPAAEDVQRELHRLGFTALVVPLAEGVSRRGRRGTP